MPLLLMQLGPEAAQVLGILGRLVALTGDALAGSLFMIETSAVEFPPALHILILRLFLRVRILLSRTFLAQIHTMLTAVPCLGLCR